VIFRGLGPVVPVAAALILVAATRARAQAEDGGAGAPPAREQAQQLLQQGNELFRADRFAEALTTYREAQRMFPSPKLFFNIAACEESLGRRPQAMSNLFAFVKQALDADPLVRTEAERRMAQLATTLAAVDVSLLPSNARITVDAEAVGLTPLDRPLWLEPGPHRVSVDRPGRPLWVTTLDGKAGTLTALTVPEAPIPAARDTQEPGGSSAAALASPPSEASYLRRTWWIWAAAGVLVAGAATLVVVKLLECPATTCR
jgi:tetratricopeptide (TPR) repeat protein